MAEQLARELPNIRNFATLSPIPGLRRPDQVEVAAAALGWSLSLEERQRLDGLVQTAGAARMPANPFQSA